MPGESKEANVPFPIPSLLLTLRSTAILTYLAFSSFYKQLIDSYPSLKCNFHLL